MANGTGTRLQTTLEKELQSIKARIEQSRAKAATLEQEAIRFQNFINDISEREFTHLEKENAKKGRHH